MKNFVSILASNKRLALLPEIHSQFELFKANQEKSVDVEVVSAFDLADATVRNWRTYWAKNLSAK